MRTSKTPGEYILIILLALLFCWMSYRAYLNFIGYCPDKGRVLTEQEKLAPVIEYLALAHPRDAGPPLVPPKETRLYYDSMQEFLRDNPDCCHVVKAFYTIDTGWFRLGVWNRLCGFATYLVSVKFYRRYRNERGEVRKELAEGGYPMTSCGKIVDLVELEM
jgi:hypothetical protein